MIEKCSVCKQDFRDCPHSFIEHEKRIKDNELDVRIRKIVKQELEKERKK